MDRFPHTRCAGWYAAAVLAVGLACAPATIAREPVDLGTLDEGMHGTPAQVMVLATLHLSQLEDFDPAGLEPLLDRLASFDPEIITIERLKGEECDLYARHPTVYPGGGDWCPATAEAREATGLDVPSAIAAAEVALASWPEQPTPAQRRRLASLFLAAGDPASAYVQWLRLAPGERRSGDGLDDTLAAKLRELGTRNGEDLRIAARLAARLGHDRVYPVDNHTGDHLRIGDLDGFGTEIQAAWDTTRAEHAPVYARQDALARSGDMLALYRYLNGPESMEAAAESNIQGPMRFKSGTGYPQAWVAGWEIRNLRMVANIRETFRERPGARVLTVVGASHKPWFDAWLGQLQGVEIVDVQEILD